MTAMQKRKIILAALCVLIVAAFGIHYADAAGAICGGASCGGETAAYFLGTFAPQVWNSLIVFTLIWWFGAPAAAKYLADRKARIERDIDESSRVKAEAQARADEAAQLMRKLDSEKRQMRSSYETATENACKQIEEDAAAQGERLKRDAETSFELQAATARRRFGREVADASIASAQKDIEMRLSQDAALRDRLIDRSIASFELQGSET